MRRWAPCFAVVTSAVASTAMLSGCDLGLTPFVEPSDAEVVPDPAPPTDAASPPLDDAGEPPEDAAKPDAGDAADGGGPKRVFVTSLVTNGGFGGLNGGDLRCQQAATSGALGGAWIAWLSVAATPAAGRIKDVGPWFLVDGKTRVFASKVAITTTGPEVPIDRDEKGAQIVNPELVWTGTAPAGTPANQLCNGWISAALGQGLAGSTKQKDVDWTQSQNANCGQQLHLYCIEQ